MAKMTKAQQKRLALAMKQKAFKLLTEEVLTLKEYESIVRIKQNVMKKLGYPPKTR